MIGPIKTVSVYVQDRSNAVEFYSQRLGFASRRTASMGPGGRWIRERAPAKRAFGKRSRTV
jgi:predicted enzyme related to lactoylglutathione lyase